MYEQYLIDNPPVQVDTGKAVDPEYEEPEHYHDPDFSKEWEGLGPSSTTSRSDWEEVE